MLLRWNALRKPFPFFFDGAAAKEEIFATQIICFANQNGDKDVSPLQRRGGLRALHPRKLLKKFDQNFS